MMETFSERSDLMSAISSLVNLYDVLGVLGFDSFLICVSFHAVLNFLLCVVKVGLAQSCNVKGGAGESRCRVATYSCCVPGVSC